MIRDASWYWSVTDRPALEYSYLLEAWMTWNSVTELILWASSQSCSGIERSARERRCTCCNATQNNEVWHSQNSILGCHPLLGYMLLSHYMQTKPRSINYTVSPVHKQQTTQLNSTVEPLNNGHIGTRHFLLFSEVVLSSEVQNALRKMIERWTFRSSKCLLFWEFSLY